jgi:hypothetical protein
MEDAKYVIEEMKSIINDVNRINRRIQIYMWLSGFFAGIAIMSILLVLGYI